MLALADPEVQAIRFALSHNQNRLSDISASSGSGSRPFTEN